MEKKRCPVCFSADTRRSYPGHLKDQFLKAIFKLEPYRCRSCRKRFFSRTPTPVDHLAEA
jgi:transposase-like protein